MGLVGTNRQLMGIMGTDGKVHPGEMNSQSLLGGYIFIFNVNPSRSQFWPLSDTSVCRVGVVSVH